MNIFQRVYGYALAESQLKTLLEVQEEFIKLKKKYNELERKTKCKTLR